jgi:hypothetical protein
MPGASGFNANPAAGATDRELVFAAAAPRRSEEPPPRVVLNNNAADNT